MKYNVTDYNRAKNLLEVLEKDILELNRNYVLILWTKQDLVSCIIYKKKLKFVSSAANNVSAGMVKSIYNIKDVDIYPIFRDTKVKDFISLRAFDFQTYDDLINGHLDPEINSEGAAKFFKNYEAQLKNVIIG